LNITVSSGSIYELPRLLNYLTAPEVLIWSAVTTSCSIPLIFPPSELLAKDPKTHQTRPWNAFPERWIDGSVDNDIPMAKLSELFNVDYFIVSQTNPHIIPFLQGSAGWKRAHGPPKGVTKETAIGWAVRLLCTVVNLIVSEIMHQMLVMSELGIFPFVCAKVRVGPLKFKFA
jgi:predicted acylesterase/phospholipase RssA